MPYVLFTGRLPFPAYVRVEVHDPEHQSIQAKRDDNPSNVRYCPRR